MTLYGSGLWLGRLLPRSQRPHAAETPLSVILGVIMATLNNSVNYEPSEVAASRRADASITRRPMSVRITLLGHWISAAAR